MAVLAVASAGIGAASSQQGPEPGMIAFTGVNVVSMKAGEGVAADQTVLVGDGRIIAIGPASEVDVPPAATRVEAAGKYLMPGLADMHVHLEYFDDPDLLRLFIANGVTLVRNMDGRPHVLEWRTQVESGELAGPTIYTAGPILDGDPPQRDDNTVVRDAAEARSAVLEQAARGYDFIKVYTNLSEESYRAILETARDEGLPVAGHLPRDVDLRTALGVGQQAIEHLTDYGEAVESEDSPHRGRWHWSRLFFAIPVDPTRIAITARDVARARVWTIPTLVQAEKALVRADTLRAVLAAKEMAYIPTDVREFWDAGVRRQLERMDPEDWRIVDRGHENRLRMVAALHEAGAGLLVGTDTPNPFVVPGFSVHEELALFVATGLTPAEALAAATREAARFLGRLDELGTVEVGKRADLLLLDADPLEDVANVRRIAGVVVRGDWLPAGRLEAMLADLRN